MSEKSKRLFSGVSCLAAAALSAAALLAFAPDAADAQAKAKKKKPAAEQPVKKDAKKKKQATPETDAREDAKTAGTAAPAEAPEKAAAAVDVNAAADPASMIRSAMKSLAARDVQRTARMTATVTVEGDSGETMVFTYTERYAKPLSAKKDIAAKYDTPAYFNFQSELCGLMGHQIMNREGTKPIDMVCYQVATDAVVLGYATPPEGAKTPFKLSAEGSFTRSALDSAIDWKRNGAISFFDINRLSKRMKPAAADGSPTARITVGYEGAGPSLTLLAYASPADAADALKAMTEKGGRRYRQSGRFLVSGAE